MKVGEVMTPDEVDQAQSGLTASYDRITTRMFRLDGHPALSFLQDDGLTGTTQRVATEVPAAVAAMWPRFAALGHYLDQLREIRSRRARPGRRELAELTRLLRDPVVGLDHDNASPAVDPPAPVTVPELARELENGAAVALRRLDSVQAAVSEVVDELTGLEKSVNQLQQRAAELGEPDVAGPTVELARLSAQLLADPLGAVREAPARRQLLAGIRTELGRTRARLAELVRLREEYPARLDRLQRQLDELAAVEAAAAATHRAVHAAIADPGLPPAPAAAPELASRLPALAGLAGSGAWPRVAEELADLAGASVTAHRQASRARAAATRLLDQRTGLRGRLAALADMAAKDGVAEHPDLSQQQGLAEQLLAQPCDLPAATKAVARYRRLLTGLVGRPSTDPPDRPVTT